MPKTIKQRLALLEDGDRSNAERYAILNHEFEKRCDDLDIEPPTEAERVEFQRGLDAAKPDDWDTLSNDEQAEFMLAYIMRDFVQDAP